MKRERTVTKLLKAKVRAKIPEEVVELSPGDQVYFMHRKGSQAVFARMTDVWHAVKNAVNVLTETGASVAKITVEWERDFEVDTEVFDASTTPN